MRSHLITYLLLVFGLTACGGGEDLSEDYIAVASKIVAVQIEESEVAPSDTIAMRLLVAGTMDQNSAMPVTWLIGGDSEYQLESPYNVALEIAVPADVLGNEESIDVPVVATVTIDERTLSATKLFRVTNNPVGKNPVISGVKIDWKAENADQTTTIDNGATLTFVSDVPNFACTSITEELPDAGNEKLVYRWYVSKSSNSEKQIEIEDDKGTIENLLGQGAKAAEFRQSAVFAISGREGGYSVYLVVRDNRENSTDSTLDRLGTDFFHFNVIVE